MSNENINSELSFGGGFMQFRPLAQKLQPPEVDHLGGPCGACPHVHIPSWSGKICSNFNNFFSSEVSFQPTDMIFLSNESSMYMLSYGLGFSWIRQLAQKLQPLKSWAKFWKKWIFREKKFDTQNWNRDCSFKNEFRH